ANFPAEALWPAMGILPGRSLSWSIVLIPVLAALLVFFKQRTAPGLSLRYVGSNENAARWAGLNSALVGSNALIVSGGFAGVAGAALLFAGRAPWMSEGFEAGIGFTGIAVALLARNSAVASMFTAVLFSSLSLGSTSLQAKAGVPSTLSDIVQGTIIVLVLASIAILVTLQGRNR